LVAPRTNSRANDAGDALPALADLDLLRPQTRPAPLSGMELDENRAASTLEEPTEIGDEAGCSGADKSPPAPPDLHECARR